MRLDYTFLNPFAKSVFARKISIFFFFSISYFQGGFLAVFLYLRLEENGFFFYFEQNYLRLSFHTHCRPFLFYTGNWKQLFYTRVRSTRSFFSSSCSHCEFARIEKKAFSNETSYIRTSTCLSGNVFIDRPDSFARTALNTEILWRQALVTRFIINYKFNSTFVLSNVLFFFFW